MSTSRLADLRVRAAASQVVRLDVRGPVSQALGRAGITVPPAPLADEPRETTTPVTAPTPTASRAKTPAARRVLKPFPDEPWPTAHAMSPVPARTLSGLTADERRVHRILLDTLAMQNDQGYGQGVVGLSYAEKQNLAVLDLAFIDAEIVRMDRGAEWWPRNMPVFGVVSMTALVAVLSLVTGDEGMAFAFGMVSLGVVLVFGMLVPFGGPVFTRASTPRRKIYDALRELAVLADPEAVTSDALAQADAVIDRLADADDAPRFHLNGTPTPAASAAGRTRTRS